MYVCPILVTVRIQCATYIFGITGPDSDGVECIILEGPTIEDLERTNTLVATLLILMKINRQIFSALPLISRFSVNVNKDKAIHRLLEKGKSKVVQVQPKNEIYAKLNDLLSHWCQLT